ncbi:CHAT domain-containing protein [Phytomonospora sp. NPDC050363]|uniref:CHAT domain-containing protein n=1 Tax=Phytomonospora sp. NPDC050363 TaxID=3155642 RepID=UPI0033E1B9DB
MRPTDPAVLAEARRLHTAGREAANAGRLIDSVVHLRHGLELLGWAEGKLFEGGGESAATVGRLLMTLAFVEADQGDTEHGLYLLNEAESYTINEDKGIYLQQRAQLLRMCGRLPEALEAFDLAEPLLVEHGHTETLLALYLNRGALHGAEGRFSAALQDWTRCQLIAEEDSQPIWSAKAAHARGIVAKLLGDVPAALTSLRAAQVAYWRHAPKMAAELMATHAHVLHAAGLIHEAYLRLNTAMEEFRDQNQNYIGAIAEVLRAQLALEMGNPELAAQQATVGEERARRQGDLGLAAGAELVFRFAEFEFAPRSSRMAEDCERLAIRHRELGRIADADLATLLATRIWTAVGDVSAAERTFRPVARARASEQISVRLSRAQARAELIAAQAGPVKALSSIRSGLGLLQDFRSRLGSVELQVGATYLGRKLAGTGLSYALQSAKAQTMFTWSERSRAQAFRLPPIRPAEDPETADLLAQVRQLRDRIRRDELAGKTSREDKARCAALERTLRERSWLATGPGESIPEYSASRIRAELKRRESCLVSFLAHEGRMHVLVLDGKLRHVELGSSTEVEEAARRLVADLDALTGRRLPPRMADSIRASIHHQTDWLAKELFGRILPFIGDRDLVVVPTQLLSSLPWGLLPPLRGRPVTVAPSAAVWMAAATREWTHGGTPLLSAGPDLANVEAELAGIAQHYPQGTVLRAETATAAATLAALDGAPIAHLAAHGHHEPDNVLFSRLDFADGPLMAYDIARLAAPPRHVTLSACDVGRSVVAVGDETLGFTAALLYAGTSTVVSSVARVAHDVAADVMVEYHRRIADGVAPARALAEANAKHDLAPFVLFGAG